MSIAVVEYFTSGVRYGFWVPLGRASPGDDEVLGKTPNATPPTAPLVAGRSPAQRQPFLLAPAQERGNTADAKLQVVEAHEVEMERCHLWLAQFSDRAEVDEYFEEVVPYPADSPISLFVEDQDKRFYDHDWVFFEFQEGGDLRAILDAIRAPARTRETVLAAAAMIDFQCNAVIVADEDEFPHPVSVAGPPRLAYIGCHPFWGVKADVESDAASAS